MPSRSRLALISVSVVLSLAAPSVVSAQFGLKRRIEGALGGGVGGALERMLRGRVKCVFDDLECIEKANKKKKPPVLTDREGNIITDDNGLPITDPAAAAAKIGAPDPTSPAPAPAQPAEPAAAVAPRQPATAAAPTQSEPADPLGTGVWVDYDFLPGDRVLFYDDFSENGVGDFPQRFDLLAGNWEVAQWGEVRYLQATSNGSISLELPETLPERFTVEFPASVQHGNSYVRLSTTAILHGERDYAGSAVSLESNYAGLRPIRREGPNVSAKRREGSNGGALVTVRVMADGPTMKMYLDDHQVASAPNAVFPRTNKLFFNVSSASPTTPALIGAIRVAAGGLGLYDRLEAEGRVATQGISFAANSDVIRPQSTPMLKEVADILAAHPELRLSIEGHTDSEADDNANLELSIRRAVAVKSVLISTYGVSAGRLEAEGFGDTRPVADNGTLEGKQQNRRMEIVKLN